MRNARLFMFAAAVVALVFATGLSAAAGDLDATFDGDGKVITDFAGGSNDAAFAVAIQADGKAVVVGEVISGADDGFAVVRYTENGALDPTFGVGGKVRTEFASQSVEWAVSLAIQGDGKILVVGPVGIPGTGTGANFGLARYNPDGTLDAGFDGDGKVVTDFSVTTDFPSTVAVQSNGKIVAAGSSRPFGGVYDVAVARYNADGSLDGSFGGDGKVVTSISAETHDYAAKVAVQPDGRIVAGGGAQTQNASSAALLRYLPDGSLDGSFDGDGKVVLTTPTSSISDLALQSDGKIVTSGGTFRLTRFNENGSLDDTFDGDGNSLFPSSYAIGLAIQSDGRVVAAGSVGFPDIDFAVARFDARGAVDSSFGSGGGVRTDLGGPGTRDIAYGVAVGPDGKVVVAGYTGPAGGEGPNDFAVARYLAAPPPCKVPNVRGKKLAAAKARIKKARCAVGKVTRKPSQRVKKGRVLSQSPKAGVTVPSGGKVKLVVSKGHRR
jgi:uncharacterized delta-60 repeat protein